MTRNLDIVCMRVYGQKECLRETCLQYARTAGDSLRVARTTSPYMDISSLDLPDPSPRHHQRPLTWTFETYINNRRAFNSRIPAPTQTADEHLRLVDRVPP
jgi:hypothetical protein